MSTLGATFQPHGPVPITVRTQTLDGTALVTVTLGGYFEGELTIQGAAADIVHLVEVLRAEVAAAVGQAWPVETVHADAPALTNGSIG